MYCISTKAASQLSDDFDDNGFNNALAAESGDRDSYSSETKISTAGAIVFVGDHCIAEVSWLKAKLDRKEKRWNSNHPRRYTDRG